MKCKQCRELFGEALYNELPVELKSEFDKHVASCVACAKEFDEIKATLKIMNQRTRTEPDRAYWNSFWDQLNQKLSGYKKESLHVTSTPKRFALRPARIPSWAYGIAAMFMVAMGIYLGRTYFAQHEVKETEQGNQIADSSSPAIEDSATTQALAYLDRSRNLLIGLANLNEEQHPSLDLTRQQAASRQLIQQASMLKVALNKPDQQLMRKLVQDLEVILLQLANVEVRPGHPAVEMVKNGIDQKSILLKINLEEMRAMARRSPIAPAKKSKTNI